VGVASALTLCAAELAWVFSWLPVALLVDVGLKDPGRGAASGIRTPKNRLRAARA
jgi:hypothetical protein